MTVFVVVENNISQDVHQKFKMRLMCFLLKTVDPEKCCMSNNDLAEICALVQTGEKDFSCEKDSRGALMCGNIQVGIHSTGYPCGLKEGEFLITREYPITNNLLRTLPTTEMLSSECRLLRWKSNLNRFIWWFLYGSTYDVAYLYDKGYMYYKKILKRVYLSQKNMKRVYHKNMIDIGYIIRYIIMD